MNPAGQADARNGIREFIIGTGGESLDTVLPSTPNLQAYDDQHYGVMKMGLEPGRLHVGLRDFARERGGACWNAGELQRYW